MIIPAAAAAIFLILFATVPLIVLNPPVSEMVFLPETGYQPDSGILAGGVLPLVTGIWQAECQSIVKI